MDDCYIEPSQIIPLVPYLDEEEELENDQEVSLYNLASPPTPPNHNLLRLNPEITIYSDTDSESDASVEILTSMPQTPGMKENPNLLTDPTQSPVPPIPTQYDNLHLLFSPHTQAQSVSPAYDSSGEETILQDDTLAVSWPRPLGQSPGTRGQYWLIDHLG